MIEKPALYCRYISKGFNSSSSKWCRSGAAPRSKTLGVLSNSRGSSSFSSSSGSSSSKGRSSLYYDSSSSQAPLPSL